MRLLQRAGVVVAVVGMWCGGAAYAVTTAYDVTAAHAPAPTPSHPAEPSRAGSRAGEGRERPGRAEETQEPGEETAGEGDVDEDPQDAQDEGAGDESPDASEPPQEAAAQVTPTPPPQPVRQAVAHAERPTEPVLRILPLGSGLVLIGLGLGLAFVGLRLRRG
ncbi:hypothetical protein ACYF6T_15930 [Streptomyces sp. 7R007]